MIRKSQENEGTNWGRGNGTKKIGYNIAVSEESISIYPCGKPPSPPQTSSKPAYSVFPSQVSS
jgi:hypothetical protein